MFFLVRHAIHSLGPGTLAGRTAGVGLTDKGHAQAARLGERLERESITAVHSSPQQRTLETAHPIAERCGVGVEISEALDEVDFGAWAGKSFEALDQDPRWVEWNVKRETAATPAGERIADVAARFTRHIEGLLASESGGRIVLVSHAEPIRTAILHYLGLAPSAWSRLDIDPASISQLVFAGQMRIAGLNERVSA
jgi:broad specificity phosphatase PhoE